MQLGCGWSEVEEAGDAEELVENAPRNGAIAGRLLGRQSERPKK
tara:strand:- start:4279 stop:4410 length:132 start_codon:yes stop_codon:yes gene_type:complete